MNLAHGLPWEILTEFKEIRSTNLSYVCMYVLCMYVRMYVCMYVSSTSLKPVRVLVLRFHTILTLTPMLDTDDPRSQLSPRGRRAYVFVGTCTQLYVLHMYTHQRALVSANCFGSSRSCACSFFV